MIEDQLKNIKGEIILTFTNVKTGKVRRYSYKNMILTFMHNAIAQRMAGQAAGDITYLAVGTGTTAPVESDTKLQTEIARKLISVRQYSGNVFIATTYFTTSEANGTLREAALYGNGVGRVATTTPDSGQIYTRVAINRTKSPADTLTVEYRVTIGA